MLNVLVMHRILQYFSETNVIVSKLFAPTNTSNTAHAFIVSFLAQFVITNKKIGI